MFMNEETANKAVKVLKTIPWSSINRSSASSSKKKIGKDLSTLLTALF